MKKLIIILLAVCLIFAGAVGYFSLKNNGGSAAEPSATAQPDATPAPTAPPVKTIDYEALYATHEPDEVVMTVGGKNVTWEDYFYWLHYYGQQVESYFSSMASYYSTQCNWEDTLEGGTESYAEYVTKGAAEAGRQIAAVEGFAAENGVSLSAEDESALAEQLKTDIAGLCGENGTEADFYEKLKETYLNKSLYERMNKVNYLYKNGFTKLYGENGALVDDETALKFLEDKGYISANHILLMTVNTETGETLDDAAKAEKKAAADKLAAELKAISDKDALVKRFAELKVENCEDTGKTLYPDGYTFLPGTMVEQFETACTALDEHTVSDVIETNYGYHVILRLPLSADAVVEYSSDGTPMTARSMKANEEYGERLQAYQDSLTINYADGFEVPDLAKLAK